MAQPYGKVKSVSKKITVKGPALKKLVLATMRTIADIVGATLGPGGSQVIIERQETGLPPYCTKDGVTVFKSLGFQEEAAHNIMEIAQDAAVRTASEAGDGPQPLWSKIMTPTGSVTMGDVKVGMEVCGTSGSTQTVVGVYPKGKKEIVEVVFESGARVDCCEDHLWSVAIGKTTNLEILTVKQMIRYKDREYFVPTLGRNLTYDQKIVGIYYTGVFTEMQCIEVSNSDHLYVTDNNIVTHNTTSATVIAEALTRYTLQYSEANPRVSPQRVVRALQKAFKDTIEPTIMRLSTHMTWSDEDDTARKLLRSVAKVSANGDDELADKVLECFDLVGDDGNVTIAEVSGPSGYEVERIEGFPVSIGYEDSCGSFYSKFINDGVNQRTNMIRPVFVIYHGVINNIQSLIPIVEAVGELWQKDGFRHNVVVVATGFSDSVLGQLAVNFANASAINVFPLMAPTSPILNGQLHFLEDVAAITGARILDQLNYPLERATVDDLGYGDGLTAFESYRFRSNIIGHVDEEEIIVRADELRVQAANASSDLDRQILQERLGKLTGGIARLKVVGPSNGETKEKRDRAEDAVCAVRGAVKHGCLPGGGWMLLKLVEALTAQNDPMLSAVLVPALLEPVNRLLTNCGMDPSEIPAILQPITDALGLDISQAVVYDALEGTHVKAFDAGLLDSTPAVLEALRNSISIASLLGTLGGIVSYGRDATLERAEATANDDFLRKAEGR